MSQSLPSFLEDHISQVPALQLLQNLGWQFLTPAAAVAFRAGKLGSVLLETVLVEQLPCKRAGGRLGRAFTMRRCLIAQVLLNVFPQLLAHD